MAVYTKIKVDMKPVGAIMKKLGVEEGGAVQVQHTKNVLHRIQRYMPMNTGQTIRIMVAQTRITKPEIVLRVPYAQYLYYGRVMVDAKTGKGPMNIPGVGLRFHKHATLKATDRDLAYNHSKNPLAGPYWDRRLVQAEGRAMAADLQRFVNRRAGK